MDGWSGMKLVIKAQSSAVLSFVHQRTAEEKTTQSRSRKLVCFFPINDHQMAAEDNQGISRFILL